FDDGRVDRRALHEIDHRRQRVAFQRGAVVRADVDVDADHLARDRRMPAQEFAVAERGEDAGGEHERAAAGDTGLDHGLRLVPPDHLLQRADVLRVLDDRQIEPLEHVLVVEFAAGIVPGGDRLAAIRVIPVALGHLGALDREVHVSLSNYAGHVRWRANRVRPSPNSECDRRNRSWRPKEARNSGISRYDGSSCDRLSSTSAFVVRMMCSAPFSAASSAPSMCSLIRMRCGRDAYQPKRSSWKPSSVQVSTTVKCGCSSAGAAISRAVSRPLATKAPWPSWSATARGSSRAS